MISTEKTTVKKSKKVARCFQNTSLYHYINYRLFASNSYAMYENVYSWKSWTTK